MSRSEESPRLDFILPRGSSPNSSLKNSKNDDSSTDVSADITFSVTDVDEDEFEDDQAVIQAKIEQEFRRWSGVLPPTTNNHSVSEREKREKIKQAIKHWTGEEHMEPEEIIKNAVKRWKGEESDIRESEMPNLPSSPKYQQEGILYLLEASHKWEQLWFVLSSDAHLLCYRVDKRKHYHLEFPRHNWFLGDANVNVQPTAPDCAITETLPQSYTGNIFSIEIHHPNERTVKHYLAAISNSERFRWISTIDQAILWYSPNPESHSAGSLGDALAPVSRSKSVGIPMRKDKYKLKEKRYVPILPKVKRLRKDSLHSRNVSPCNLSPLRKNSLSLTVSDSNSFTQDSLTIHHQESFISYWNDYLDIIKKNRKRLEIRVDDIINFGEHCTLVCKKVINGKPGNVLPVTPHSRSECGAAVHRQSATLCLKQNEIFYMYFNATFPHAIHITYENKSVIKTPQNYFVCPPQHWINGEHDKQGNLIHPFICGSSDKKIKIRVTPILREDVSFIVANSQQQYECAQLFLTPQELMLEPGDEIIMLSAALSDTRERNNMNRENSSVTVLNRTQSRKYVLPWHSKTTVGDIKQTLEALSEIPSKAQELYCRDAILNEYDLLASLKNVPEEPLIWDYHPQFVNEKYPVEMEINEDASQFVSEDQRGLCSWDFQRSCELNMYISKYETSLKVECH